MRIDRRAYTDMYGPTTGDWVRLGDTDLIVEVEQDHTVYGEECKFGGGKVLRDGMGQQSGASQQEALDLVITNALVLDYTGIYKADIGVKDGRIAGIGKAGNPDIMPGVAEQMVVGATTEVVAGEKLILTAGALDVHVHFICPQQVEEAIASGITTMLGGGTGPATGTNATTCTPGAFYIRTMLQAADAWPLNFGFLGKGNSSLRPGWRRKLRPGPAVSSCTRTGARRQRPSMRVWQSPKNSTCRFASTLTRSTSRVLSRRRGRLSKGGRFIPTTPRARAAATRPILCGFAARHTCCPLRPTRRGLSRSTP